MATPISPFALHLWNDLNHGVCKRDQRILAWLDLHRDSITTKMHNDILSGLWSLIAGSNSTKFIHQVTHQSTIQAKYDFLGELPGM